MTLSNSRSKWTKSVSVLVLFIFTLSGSTSGAATVLPEIPQGNSNIQKEIIIPVKAAESLDSVIHNIPEELGVLHEFSRTAERPSEFFKPFVVHIQDAHSNPQAQNKIHKMLKYLRKKFHRNMAVAVEGASGALHPEYFDFFPEFPDAGDAILKDLHQKGEVTGAELFAWEEYKNKKAGTDFAPTPIFGTENIELYRSNLELFRNLLFARDEVTVLLGGLRGSLQKEQSKIVNPDLRDFLKERERRKEGKFSSADVRGEGNFSAYLDYLSRQIEKVLEIDLAEPIEQLRFPNLVRIRLMKKTEKEFNSEAASLEWKKVLEALRDKAETDQERALVQTLDIYARRNALIRSEKDSQARPAGPVIEKDGLYPRQLLEKILTFANARKIDLAAYKQFAASFRLLVFQSEIEMPAMMKEIERLEAGIVGKLAVSEEEKKLVRHFENFSLLEKLLRLELARVEYEKVLARRGEILEMIQTFSAGMKPDAAGRLEKFMDTAYEFYAGARERDGSMIDNALQVFQQSLQEKAGEEVSKAKSSLVPVLVLITGGFHSDGMTELLKERGFSYAVISPRMTEIDGGELYHKVMADQNADLSFYFKNKNPFKTKQEAILFKQVIEVALPFLAKQHHKSAEELSELLKQAVETHPLLSRTLTVNLLKKNENGLPVLRFSPRENPVSAGLSARNATIPDSSLMNGGDQYEALHPGLAVSGIPAAFNSSVNGAGIVTVELVEGKQVVIQGSRTTVVLNTGPISSEILKRAVTGQSQKRPSVPKLGKTGRELMASARHSEVRSNVPVVSDQVDRNLAIISDLTAAVQSADSFLASAVKTMDTKPTAELVYELNRLAETSQVPSKNPVSYLGTGILGGVYPLREAQDAQILSILRGTSQVSLEASSTIMDLNRAAQAIQHRLQIPGVASKTLVNQVLLAEPAEVEGLLGGLAAALQGDDKTRIIVAIDTTDVGESSRVQGAFDKLARALELRPELKERLHFVIYSPNKIDSLIRSLSKQFRDGVFAVVGQEAHMNNVSYNNRLKKFSRGSVSLPVIAVTSSQIARALLDEATYDALDFAQAARKAGISIDAITAQLQVWYEAVRRVAASA